MVLKLSAAVLSFLLATSVFFWLSNEAQMDPYMDEIFHVPQARQYCDGNFTKVKMIYF
jgi:alpha-1,2-glucosyltransferase